MNLLRKYYEAEDRQGGGDREVSATPIVTEDHSPIGVFWGISFDGHNPEERNYVQMIGREQAFKLQRLIMELRASQLAALQEENRKLREFVTIIHEGYSDHLTDYLTEQAQQLLSK